MDDWSRMEDTGPSDQALASAEEAKRLGDHTKAAALSKKAIALDKYNMDAYMFHAPYLPYEACQSCLNTAKGLGEEFIRSVIGPKAFDDDGDRGVGDFWSLQGTRPYMRVLASIRREAVREKKWDMAIDTGIEMLRLCPGDNLGVRFSFPIDLCFAERWLHALNFIFNWISSDFEPGEVSPPRGGALMTSRGLSDFDPTLTTEGGKKHKAIIKQDYLIAEMLYTGARATFELWGDCEMARTFLRSAAKANLYIARHLVGNIEQPSDFNYSPRALDSPEAAQDYLFIAQPLWENNVACYEWAVSDPVVAVMVKTTCSNPYCVKKEDYAHAFNRCSACKEASYCSKKCQLQHWKLPANGGGHEEECKRKQY